MSPRLARLIASVLLSFTSLAAGVEEASERPRPSLQPIPQEVRASARRAMALEARSAQPAGESAALGAEFRDLKAALRALVKAQSEAEAAPALARISGLRGQLAAHTTAPSLASGLRPRVRGKLGQLEARLAGIADAESLALQQEHAQAALLGLEYQALRRQFDRRDERGSGIRDVGRPE